MKLFNTKSEKVPSTLLLDRYVVPPFSTLDTRLGYWQDRKRMWQKYLGDTGATRDGEFGRTYNIQKQGLYKQTSMFDPVLVECMYKWFCLPNSRILDPFGGEQTKGIVAGILGHRYVGVEIRQEQVDVNNKAAEEFHNVQYVCGDSTHIKDLLAHAFLYDFMLTSPPYFDLEEYSKSDMSSAANYEKFTHDLLTVFYQCYKLLNQDTFTVVKVGEIRDRNGEMRGFVPDTINLMKSIGWKYYNEIILINQSGTAAIRTDGNMKSRKIVKCHQNVLVFYKGDLKNIPKKFPELKEDVWQLNY